MLFASLELLTPS